jgi:hypothetical protein
MAAEGWWGVSLQRKGIILYLEYQSVCPFVRIGSQRPPSRKRVCPPLGTKGGGNTNFRVMGQKEPIRTIGEKSLAILWFAVIVYSISRTHFPLNYIIRVCNAVDKTKAKKMWASSYINLLNG